MVTLFEHSLSLWALRRHLSNVGVRTKIIVSTMCSKVAEPHVQFLTFDCQRD